ncbi:MAG: hypothetical protein A2V60_00835 [Candidatus Portnoybacteria bacterium RIFCSPHIGHO2_01_FULL_39_19]|nr:MAG: hypothetical protein A2V60_00835 [Candidatus Portnoybacteria bacterium RIFCSPHIGHO2_01_FULL_39_19]
MKKISKIFTKKSTLIIAGIILFGLILPLFAQAGLADWIVNKFYRFLAKLIISLVGMLTDLASRFFEAMLDLGFNRSYQEVAQTGWGMSRDFANLLFILFMVVVAFATILRLERYGAKQLLPTIIIIALLINFSFVICAVIIDFSNLTASIFINNAQQASGNQGVAATLTDNLKLATTLTPFDCNDYEDGIENCNELTDATAQQNCVDAFRAQLQTCEATIAASQQSTSTKDELVNLFTVTILGSIILLIAAFVFFAAGILLIIRIIAIWFLVILSPIVFICYIMPGLRNNWEKWWKSFISWCIFAPIFAFFIWLAVRVSSGPTMVRMTHFQGAITSGNPALVTGFFSNGATILNYFLVIGLLIGGLISAKQLGIYGASTALAIGKKWGKGATDWTKGRVGRAARAPKEYGAAVAGGAIEGIGKKLQGVPLLKGVGERMAARGKRVAEKPLEDPRLKKQADEIARYSTPEQISHLVKTAKTPGMTRALGRAAIEQKKFSKLDNTAKIKVADNFRAFGGDGIRIAEELEARNPSMRIDHRETDPTKLAAQETKLDKKTEEGIKKGYHKEYSEETFEGEGGEMLTESMLRTAKKFGISIDKMVSAMTVEAQEAWKGTTKAKFTDDFDKTTGADNLQARDSYAAVTGDIPTAYADSKGKINKKDPNVVTTLQKHTAEMRSSDYEKLTKDSIQHIAEYVSPAAAINMVTKLNDEMTIEFANEFNKKSDAFRSQLRKSPIWAPHINPPAAGPRSKTKEELFEEAQEKRRKDYGIP